MSKSTFVNLADNVSMKANKLHLSMPKRSEEGFTLIELLVVIIIIGVLAAIALPIFLNQQLAAQKAHNVSDLRQITEAIEIARMKTGKSLMEITGSNCTYCGFSAVDPLDVPQTHQGWATYNKTLKNISNASDIDVRFLVDATGRPYSIDENDGERTPCFKDEIGSRVAPYTGNGKENVIKLDYVSELCRS